ncbi:MAG: Holliday junction resolvase RuvX [Chitinophagaceae bacterium]|nr:Holliday junction resolvase RuvX [Chitinophagaceae bacterium]
MPRIICIDYGLKRCGIAVTDPLQIIATGLKTVPEKELIPFLKEYIQMEETEKIIIGLPKNLDDSDTHATKPAQKAFEKLKKTFPEISVEQIDEQYSSKKAVQAMHEMGMKKSKRQEKGNIDLIAATMLLQDYMGISD